MIIYLSLLVCLIGMVMYIISNNAKVQTLGIEMFKFGGLAFCLTVDSGPPLDRGIDRPFPDLDMEVFIVGSSSLKEGEEMISSEVFLDPSQHLVLVL